MGYITIIEECSYCGTDDVKVKKCTQYGTEERTVYLCPYCYGGDAENGHNDIINTFARMLNVLEARLKKGKE